MPERVEEVVETAVRYFRRKRAPGDPGEMVQEAYKIALTTCARYPDQAENPGYLFGAVRKGLGNWISKQLSILTIKDNFHKAREHQRVPVSKLPETPHNLTPEVLALESEKTVRLMRWRIQFRRALESATSGFTDEDKTLVERMFGFDGLPSEQPQDLAMRLGIPRRKVYSARRRLMRRALDDIQLRILQSELEEITAELAEEFDL